MGNVVRRHRKGRLGGNLIAQSQEVVGGYYFDLRFDRADPASVLAALLEEGLERTLLAVRATLDDVLTLLRAIALTSFLFRVRRREQRKQTEGNARWQTLQTSGRRVGNTLQTHYTAKV